MKMYQKSQLKGKYEHTLIDNKEIHIRNMYCSRANECKNEHF